VIRDAVDPEPNGSANGQGERSAAAGPADVGAEGADRDESQIRAVGWHPGSGRAGEALAAGRLAWTVGGRSAAGLIDVLARAGDLDQLARLAEGGHGRVLDVAHAPAAERGAAVAAAVGRGSPVAGAAVGPLPAAGRLAGLTASRPPVLLERRQVIILARAPDGREQDCGGHQGRDASWNRRHESIMARRGKFVARSRGRALAY
jgi:hypothetical protein